MAKAVTVVKRWGNSLGVIIPSKTVKGLHLKEGEVVDVDIVVKKRVDAFGICKGAKPFREEKEPHKEFW